MKRLFLLFLCINFSLIIGSAQAPERLDTLQLPDGMEGYGEDFYRDLGIPKEVVARLSGEQIIQLIYHKDDLRMRLEHDATMDMARPSNFLIFSIIASGMVCILLIIFGTYYYAYQIKKSQHDIIYRAIEEGQPLPENIFVKDQIQPIHYLGIIFSVLGLGIFTFSLMMEGPWTVGLTITTIGALLLLASRISRRKIA